MLLGDLIRRNMKEKRVRPRMKKRKDQEKKINVDENAKRWERGIHSK